MPSREESLEIAERVAELAQEGLAIMEELQYPLSQLQTAAIEEEQDALLASVKGILSSEAPFQRICWDTQGICNGHVSWSAEIDGMRVPEAMDDMLESSDTVFYMRHLVRELDNEGVSSPAADEVRELEERFDDVVLGIRDAIEPFLGIYEN